MRALLFLLMVLLATDALGADPQRMAIVGPDGVVSNVIVVDPDAEWAPPEGSRVVADKDGKAQAGGKYVRGKFTAAPPQPPRPVESLPLEEQVRVLSEKLKQLEH